MKEMKNDDQPAVETAKVSPEAEAARRIADPSRGAGSTDSVESVEDTRPRES